MNNHIMIDIETLSTKQNAVVLSIGAKVFDPLLAKLQLHSEFYVELDFHQQRNRDLSTHTLQWWAKQVEQNVALASTLSNTTNRVPVRNALKLFSKFITEKIAPWGEVNVWACDPDFDLAILANLFEEHKIDVPWKFYHGRSVRTVRQLAKDFNIQLPKLDATHHALDDCNRQIAEVVCFYKVMAEREGK